MGAVESFQLSPPYLSLSPGSMECCTGCRLESEVSNDKAPTLVHSFIYSDICLTVHRTQLETSYVSFIVVSSMTFQPVGFRNPIDCPRTGDKSFSRPHSTHKQPDQNAHIGFLRIHIEKRDTIQEFPARSFLPVSFAMLLSELPFQQLLHEETKSNTSHL